MSLLSESELANLENSQRTWLNLHHFKADATFYKRCMFQGAVPFFDVTAFGTYGDNSHDDTVSLQKAMDKASSNGGALWIPVGNYKISDNIDVDQGSVQIFGSGTDSVITQTVDGKGIFNVTSADVLIRDLSLVGTGSGSYSASSRAVYAHGADSSNYIADIICQNLYCLAWKDSGIYLQFVKQFLVEACNVQQIAGHGIICMSCLEGEIVNNHIEDMTCQLTASNGYGIILTRTTGAVATYPTTKRVYIAGNTIRDCPWEGIDTHSGESLQIIGNKVFDCEYGIIVTISSDGEGAPTYYPATDVQVAHNLIDAENIVGTARSGIEFASTATTVSQTGSIIGNTIKGHGNGFVSPAGESYGGAIVAYRTRNLLIEGNRIQNASSSGIDLVRDNLNFICSGNSIDDAFGFSSGAGAQDACWGIYAGTGGGNDGVISGNTISRGAFSVANGVYLDTAAKGYGITIADGVGNVVHMGHNWVEATFPLTDTTHRCTVTDAEAYATSAALSSGATYTFTNLIPAGTLVWGVTCRVTTLITGATSFEVGDGTDADRWGHLIAVAANTTTSIADFTIASPVYYAAATSVVLTANVSDFTAGVVKAIVHYMKLRIPVA